MKIAPLAFGLAIVAAATSVLSAATPGHVTYSAAQAARGRTLYYGKCASCHGAKLEGISGPALMGPDANLKIQKLSAVWDYVTVNMPMGNAGGLPKAEYVSLMAFILKSNGVPTSKNPATPTSMKSSQTDIGKLR